MSRFCRARPPILSRACVLRALLLGAIATIAICGATRNKRVPVARSGKDDAAATTAITATTATAAATATAKPLAPVKGDYMRPDVLPTEILEAAGYVAQEHFFTTHDGYILSITRGTNPLFNEGKSGLKDTLPLLFIPGTDLSASMYLSNANGVRPKNFRKRANLADFEEGAALVEALDRDPSVRSLPFLAMNFGYEVWLLQRRGGGRSYQKEGHQNRTIADALKAVPGAMLKSSFSLTMGMDAQRPQAGKSVRESQRKAAGGDTKGKGKGRAKGKTRDPKADDSDKESVRSFWRDLTKSVFSFESLSRVLENLGKFDRDFVRTFDPDYWSFSLDEQAKYDVPQAVSFVLKKSGKAQVHSVGTSSGGALILMAAAEQPRLAKKIASALLWAPSLNMGSDSDIVYLMSLLSPIFSTYAGPLPFAFFSRQLVVALQSACATKLTQRTLCLRLTDIIFGYSGDNQAQFTPANLATFLQPTSVYELLQLGQFAHTPLPCKMNFSTPAKNMKVYGAPKAPCYDLGLVKLKNIHFYQGNSDSLVSLPDVEETVRQLTVPARVHFLNEPGLYFNHVGCMIHDDNGRLVVAPSLLDMFRAERKPLSDAQTSAPKRPASAKEEKKKMKKKAEISSSSRARVSDELDEHEEPCEDEHESVSEEKRNRVRAKTKTKTTRARGSKAKAPRLKSKGRTTRSGNVITDYFL